MVFSCTLDMIKGDFQSYPDHRVKFYELLAAVNAKCFHSLFLLQPAHMQLYVDSLLFALKHEHPQVADLGLKTLYDFLEKVLSLPADQYTAFFSRYYRTILLDILVVLTDTLHKSGIKRQVQILHMLIRTVEMGKLGEMVTQQLVCEFLAGWLRQSFDTVSDTQAESFVLNLFNKCDQPQAFMQNVRDLLVFVREYGGDDPVWEAERAEARTVAAKKEEQRRMQVPGLVPVHDRPGNDDEML
mmetsp:Transcript_13807/g.31041  ORF Transcript_13807/g.31041 Transcript_13807/m.31041 type:complete len:242 (-) Transcript_13807:79-804(-)